MPAVLPPKGHFAVWAGLPYVPGSVKMELQANLRSSLLLPIRGMILIALRAQKSLCLRC
jgi:hypothetical protein